MGRNSNHDTPLNLGSFLQKLSASFMFVCMCFLSISSYGEEANDSEFKTYDSSSQCLIDVLKNLDKTPVLKKDLHFIPKSSKAGLKILRHAKSAYIPKGYPGVGIYSDKSTAGCRKRICDGVLYVESEGMAYVSKPFYINYEAFAISSKHEPFEPYEKKIPQLYANQKVVKTFGIQALAFIVAATHVLGNDNWFKEFNYETSREIVLPYYHINELTLDFSPENYCPDRM